MGFVIGIRDMRPSLASPSAVRPVFWIGSGLSFLGEHDSYGLLAACDLLAGAAALERAPFPLVHNLCVWNVTNPLFPSRI